MSTVDDSSLEKGSWLAMNPKGISAMYGSVAQWVVSPVRRLRPLLSTKAWRRTSPLRPTSYLDGLRGFAALMVYFLHNQIWAHESARIVENAFGYNRQFYFACLPGIRTFFSGGHLSVAIFFVISGYVLSLKPLRLLREGDLVKLGDSLSSSLFRRWPRLYLPLILTTFIFMIFNYMIPGLTINKAESTFSEEAFKWYAEIKEFTFIFRAGGLPWFSYNDHSWAIPLEFKGSIIIYISLLIFSRCTKFARLWCELGMIFYFLYIVDGWYCSLFVSGMLLCDLDLLAEDNDLPSFLVRFEPYKDLIFTSLFIIGMYLGGVPSFSNDIQVLRESPGWHYLSFLKPQAVFMYKSFYLFWASVFIVAAIPRIPWLKSFFESPFNQYLGRISYSLYLVHGPILRTIGDRVYAAVGWAREAHVLNITRWTGVFRLPKSGPLGLEFSYIVAHMFLLPLTLWVARVVTSLIDEPSIKISRWAYDKVKPSADSPKLVT